MDIHVEVSNKIGDSILYTFDSANISNCLHNIAHTLLFNFNDKIKHSKNLV